MIPYPQQPQFPQPQPPGIPGQPGVLRTPGIRTWEPMAPVGQSFPGNAPIVPNSPESPSPLDEDAEKKLVDKLAREYESFKSSVTELHSRIDKNHKLYEAKPGPAKKFPWPGASNFSVPLIQSTVDSLHARYMKAVFGVDPIWLARPKAPQAVGAAKKAQWYLDYWADEMEIDVKLDIVVHGMLIEGNGIAKVDWMRDIREMPVDATFQVPGMPIQAVTEYEGPELTAVPLKDFILIPADSPTIEAAVYVGHRVFRTREQIERARDDGHYFNVQKLFDAAKNGDPDTTKIPHPSGLISSHSNSLEDTETQQFELIELYGKYDYGGGAIPTIFTFSPLHKILLRIGPHPYEYGRAPYINFCVYPRANQFFGKSIPEVLESIQEELTAFHNMRSDALTRKIAPPFLKRKGSGWDPEKQKWAPGAVIEVTDPAEIVEMQMSDIPGSVFTHEQDLLAFSERVTGTSDYFMGRSPSQNRTATEVNRVTSEGLARIDVGISRFQSTMKRLAWHLWWMLYQYRPFWDYFYAEATEMGITKFEMRPVGNGLMPFEFVPQGTQSDASKEAQRQQALTLLGVVQGPLSQFNPDGLQYMLDDILRQFDVQDRAQILGAPWTVLQDQINQAYEQGMQEGQQAVMKELEGQAEGG